MTAKIRISYENSREAEHILKLLSPVIKTTKIKESRRGPYKKVYVDVEVKEETEKP